MRQAVRRINKMAQRELQASVCFTLAHFGLLQFILVQSGSPWFTGVHFGLLLWSVPSLLSEAAATRRARRRGAGRGVGRLEATVGLEMPALPCQPIAAHASQPPCCPSPAAGDVPARVRRAPRFTRPTNGPCKTAHPVLAHMPLLQEMFQRVYGVRSSSNNNLWLRKKLIEAVNTRGRGGSGSGSDAPRPTYHPRPVMRGDPTGGGGAAAGGGGEDAGRRRRKKSAPTRASDGLQVMLGREGGLGAQRGGVPSLLVFTPASRPMHRDVMQCCTPIALPAPHSMAPAGGSRECGGSAAHPAGRRWRGGGGRRQRVGGAGEVGWLCWCAEPHALLPAFSPAEPRLTLSPAALLQV